MKSGSTAIAISRATADDANDVHRLIEELARTTGLAGKFSATTADYRAFGFGKDPLFEVLVARVDGEVAGVALYFFTFSSWRGQPGVYLQDLVVTASARGQGIGEQLMQRLAKDAGERGATHLRLAVDRENEAACHFYERCGLSKSETDYVYEIDGAKFSQLGSV